MWFECSKRGTICNFVKYSEFHDAIHEYYFGFFFRCVFSSLIKVFIGYISHADFLHRFLILVKTDKIKF